MSTSEANTDLYEAYYEQNCLVKYYLGKLHSMTYNSFFPSSPSLLKLSVQKFGCPVPCSTLLGRDDTDIKVPWISISFPLAGIFALWRCLRLGSKNEMYDNIVSFAAFNTLSVSSMQSLRCFWRSFPGKHRVASSKGQQFSSDIFFLLSRWINEGFN